MKQIPKAQKSNLVSWLCRRPSRDEVTEPFAPNCPAARPAGLSKLLLTAAACAAVLVPASTYASLLAYEGFNYTSGTGNLTGQSGGFGWKGTWNTVNNGSSDVQLGSLVAGANAPAGYDALSSGNSAFTPNGTRTGRSLDNSVGGLFGAKGYIDGNGNIGAAGKTVYISFMQKPNASDNNYYEFEFHRGDLGDGGRIGGVGNDTGGSSSVYLRTPSSSQTLIGPGGAAVNFYVVRIDFQGGNDTVTVYQNPTSATEPATATLTVANAGDMSFNGLSFGAFVNGRTVAHDEIRVGETYADVLSSAVYSSGIWDGGGANNNWSSAGNWDNDVLPLFPVGLTFTGNARLNSTNDLTDASVNGILFDAAAGACTLSGNSLTLNGNIGFSAEPAALITQTLNLPLTPGGNVVVSPRTNGNIVINGDITGANTELTQGTTGNSGLVTLAGNNTLKGFVVNNGTNFLTGTTTINGIGGSSFFYLANGDVTRTATLVIQPGATLSVNGGFQDAAVLGRDGGVATVIQNGGTFNFNITDGSHEFIFVGASGNPNTRSTYNMNGGVLDMNGKTLGIALGANTLVTGVVNQVSGVITNVGNLYFSPFFTQGHGIYNLTGGSLYIGTGGITVFAGGGYELNLGGGTIGAADNWASALNMSLTGVNGPVTFNPAGFTITLSGVLSGSGGLTVAGAGTLELSGANTYTGDTTVSSGSTLTLDNPGSTPGAVRLATGASLVLNFTGAYVAGNLYTNGVALPDGDYDATSLAGFITGSGTLQVKKVISNGLWTGLGGNANWSTGGNWDNNIVPVFPHAVTFAGTSRLSNNNDLTGITLSGITFDAAAGAFVIGGNDITLSGDIAFSAAPANPVTQTVNLNQTWSADKTIATPANASLTLGGSIFTAPNRLTKTGPGTLTLGGADSFSGYYVNGGTNVITGNVSISGTSGSFVFLGNGDTNFNGTLVIQPSATLTVDGTFDDAMVIGRDGGSGRVIQNGGTFSYNNPAHAYLFIGATSRAGTTAEYDMNGGTLEMNGNTLGVALGDNGATFDGILNQTGGTIDHLLNLNLGSIRLYGHGVYNLSGGRINIDAGGITSDSGSYELNLGGGTIAALSTWASPLKMNLTNVNGAVTFDTMGNTITLSGNLSGTGGLTVTGGGTVDLGGTNTYSGDTTVASGTLQLDVPGTSPSKVKLATGTTLNLNYTGTLIVPGFTTNGVALPVGTYSAGNMPGFITGTGDLQVAGVVFTTDPQNQVVYLNGDYGQAVTLTSQVTGGTPTYQWYRNDSPISGATSSSLTLSDIGITNGGNFYVVATTGSGSITSSVAAVTVYAVNNNVFVYDGFDYDAGAVDGTTQNGGFGWNGPWQAVDGTGVIIPGSGLVGGANVPVGYDARSARNSIEVPSNAQTRSGRYFDCSPTGELAKQGFVDANGNIGANGKTIYLAFLQQPDRTSGFYELEFHRGNLSDPGRIGGIGNDAAGNNVNLRAPNGVNNRSLGAGDTGVDLYVVRIDYKAGNDDVFVYRNPTSLTEPATPTLTVSNVADMSLNGVSVAAYNGPDLKVDEIRLGATWADAIGLAVSNLLPPARTPNGFAVQFAATPGFSYRIQRAPAVTGPWTDVSTNVAPANGYVQFEDTQAPAGGAFYRTVTP